MSKNKNIKRSLYILTEGHTEQAYFSRISEILGDEDEWKYSVTVDVREIVDGSKTDPVNMVKEAKKSQKSYDEIWVVFDKDRCGRGFYFGINRVIFRQYHMHAGDKYPVDL